MYRYLVATGVGLDVGDHELEILRGAEERLEIEKILEHDAEAVHVEELAKIGGALQRWIGFVFFVEAGNSCRS